MLANPMAVIVTAYQAIFYEHRVPDLRALGLWPASPWSCCGWPPASSSAAARSSPNSSSQDPGLAAIVIRDLSQAASASGPSGQHTTLKSELLRVLLRRKRQGRAFAPHRGHPGASNLTIPRGKTVGIIGRNG